MIKNLHYAICTVFLAMALMLMLHGSRKILQTYQVASVYEEAVKIGAYPDDRKAAIFARRGLKDGLVHLVFLFSGGAVAFATCVYMARKR